MKTKLVVLLVALAALSGSLFAQGQQGIASNPLGGDITATSASCATVQSCVWMRLPSNGSTATVTLAGTFVQTDLIELSGDGGNTWATNATLSAGGITSVSVNGFSDIRVRCSAFTSGRAQVTINVGILQVQSVVAGGSSSSSGAVNAAPNMGTYLANACNVANTNSCFFTFADLQLANDCNWSAVAVDLFCTASHFVVGDVGKNLMGAQSFAGDNQGSGSGGQIATTTGVTIASFISGTHITLSATPANAVASNGSIAWGHLDDAGALAMTTAMQASATCPIGMLSSSYYYISKPAWNYVNATAVGGNGCGALPTAASYTGSSFGTTSFPAGFALEGRYGTGPTTIFLDTSFPNGDTCAHTVTGATLPACFAIPIMGKWSNLLMSGGNQPTAANLNGKTLLSMQVGTLENFTGMNMGWNNGAVTGIAFSTLSQFLQVNNAGWGGIGIAGVGGAAYARAVGLIVENSATAAITLGAASAAGTPSLTCYWCIFDMPQGITNKPVITNAGGNLLMYGGTVQPSNTPSTTNTGMTGYKCTASGGSLVADGVNFNFTIGGSGMNGIWLNAQNCTATISNSYVSSNQAGSAVINDNGSTSGTRLWSTGGNTWIGNASITAGINLNFAPTDVLGGLTTYTITCSANCGTSPSVSGRNESMVVTLGSATPAASTFTLTFAGNWPAAPSCQATRATTGTTPVPTGVVTTTTTAVVNLSANMVASEKYSVTCGPGAL